METEDPERCAVCREQLDGDVFTWPGCSNAEWPVAHRMHAECLSGMLGSLPGWPRERPAAQDAANAIREAVARGTPGHSQRPPPPPHLVCPLCRHQWRDIDGIAGAALALQAWPVPPAAVVTDRAVAEQQRPPRPAIAMVACGGQEREEMEWSTYRRHVSSPGNPQQPMQAEWRGEWQCTANACGGAHTAPAEPVGAPAMWMRPPAPHAVLPSCHCASMKLVPWIFHDPDAAQDSWSYRWVCMRCGPWDTAARELPTSAVALELAAGRMGLAQWHAATAASFWGSVRACAAEAILGWQDAGRHNFLDTGPARLTAPTNSQIYVPLLLDAAGALSATARQAWRRHESTSAVWEHWVQTLRAAQSVTVETLVRELQTCMRTRRQVGQLTKDVCLLWHCALQIGGADARVDLDDVVRASRTRLGYLPGPVQEILLENFGGPQLSQSAALHAAAIRARTAERRDDARVAGPSAGFVSGGALATSSLLAPGIVSVPDWRRAVAAAGEPGDAAAPPRARSEQASGAEHSDGGGTADDAGAADAAGSDVHGSMPGGAALLARGAPDDDLDDDDRMLVDDEAAAQPGLGIRAPHFSIADDNDTRGSTGLTQEMGGMDVDREPAPQHGLVPDGPPVPQTSEDSAVAGRRVRRRRGQHLSWQLLRCRMCASANAFQGLDSRGLMQHIVRMHLGQPLTAEAVEQLRALGKEACRICASIRARTTPHCATCGCATATRPLQLGDVVPDRRRGPQRNPGLPAGTSPGHGGDGALPAAGPGMDVGLAPASISQGTADEFMESAIPREAPVSVAVMQEAKKLRREGGLKRIPMCVAGRMAVSLAEALEGCLAGDDTWAFLARFIQVSAAPCRSASGRRHQ